MRSVVKLKVWVFLVGSLTAGLLGASELFSGRSEQIHPKNTYALKIPFYLTDVPPGHLQAEYQANIKMTFNIDSQAINFLIY